MGWNNIAAVLFDYYSVPGRGEIFARWTRSSDTTAIFIKMCQSRRRLLLLFLYENVLAKPAQACCYAQ
jgi:hypothetical protein